MLNSSCIAINHVCACVLSIYYYYTTLAEPQFLPTKSNIMIDVNINYFQGDQAIIVTINLIDDDVSHMVCSDNIS